MLGSGAGLAARLPAGDSNGQIWHTGSHQLLDPAQSEPGRWHAKPEATQTGDFTKCSDEMSLWGKGKMILWGGCKVILWED